MPARARKDDTNPKDRLGIKKVPLCLVPFVALIQMAMAFAEGARKYGAFNWRRKKVRRSVYIEAILRHAIALNAGEDIDPDSGLPHEAKLMACAAIMLDAKEAGCLIDDRYELDKAADLLAAFTAGDYHAAAKKLTQTPARTLDQVRAEEARRKRKARRRA
jgi:hypothetical protein